MVNTKPIAIGNYLVGVMFASLGVVELIDKDFIGASLWLSLAAAFASFGPENSKWKTIPLPRRIAGLILLGLSVALFGYQIGQHFSD